MDNTPPTPLGEALSIILDPVVSSSLFSVHETPTSGRGVFASAPLAPGTSVLSSPSPIAHVILHPFRHEVCAWCFAYDRGRRWPVTHSIPDRTGSTRGTAWFCAEACRERWRDELGELGREAWEGVDGAFHVARRMRGRANVRDVWEDELDPALEAGTTAELEQAWAEGCARAEALVAARRATDPTKEQKKLIRETHLAALMDADEDDTLFLLSYLLSLSSPPPSPSSSPSTALLSLTPSLSPYLAPHGHPTFLSRHLTSLSLLLCVLPLPLLAHCTPDTAFHLFTRDAPNSFGIRSLPSSLGSEFLGYGIWAEASYFNHSCLPNVRKTRVGRGWEFVVGDQGVGDTEELRISYLGDNVPAEMDVQARQANLVEAWGFKCDCPLCVQELVRAADGVGLA